jgi:hypothetical protein
MRSNGIALVIILSVHGSAAAWRHNSFVFDFCLFSVFALGKHVLCSLRIALALKISLLNVLLISVF